MIAGAWSPHNPAEAETILRQMLGASRLRQDDLRVGNCIVAVGPEPHGGQLDQNRKLAWVGRFRAQSEAANLDSLSHSAGDYAVIAAHQDGLVLARGRHAGRCLYFATLPGGAVAACSRL